MSKILLTDLEDYITLSNGPTPKKAISYEPTPKKNLLSKMYDDSLHVRSQGSLVNETMRANPEKLWVIRKILSFNYLIEKSWNTSCPPKQEKNSHFTKKRPQENKSWFYNEFCPWKVKNPFGRLHSAFTSFCGIIRNKQPNELSYQELKLPS